MQRIILRIFTSLLMLTLFFNVNTVNASAIQGLPEYKKTYIQENSSPEGEFMPAIRNSSPLDKKYHAIIDDFRFKDEIYFQQYNGMKSLGFVGVYIRFSYLEEEKLNNLIIVDTETDYLTRTLYHEYSHHLMRKHTDEVAHLREAIPLEEEVLTDVLTVQLMNVEGKNQLTLTEIFTQNRFSYMKEADFVKNYLYDSNIKKYIHYLLLKEYPEGYSLLLEGVPYQTKLPRC